MLTVPLSNSYYTSLGNVKITVREWMPHLYLHKIENIFWKLRLENDGPVAQCWEKRSIFGNHCIQVGGPSTQQQIRQTLKSSHSKQIR